MTVSRRRFLGRSRWRYAATCLVLIGLLPVVLGQSCGAPPDDDGTGDAQPFFPEDYRAAYTLVRDCQLSIEHDVTMIRVWANDAARDAYLAEQNPLPVGSILVKEEFIGGTCDDDGDLFQWRAMRKAVEGVDDSDGDTWQWQRVSAVDRSVAANDKATCISCHREPECKVRDYMCTEAP